ncbi:hypothetical protein OSJ05_22530, partial [Mycobacterium ulcerans]
AAAADAGPVSAGANSGSTAGAGLRSPAVGYSGLYNSANSDAGARSVATREAPANAGAGIPRSSFYPNRETADSEADIQLPLRTE